LRGPAKPLRSSYPPNLVVIYGTVKKGRDRYASRTSRGMSGSSGAHVVLVGAFDLAQRGRVTELFESVSDDPIVALDLERTTYLDSIALGCIIRLNGNLSERGGRLFLTGASAVVKRILDVTGLTGAFPGRSALDALLEERGVDAAGLRRLELTSEADE
jgi:anti-anti-sigma factor